MQISAAAFVQISPGVDTSLNTGVPRYVWAYALDANTGTRTRLSNAPLGITFPVGVVQPVQNLSASRGTYTDRIILNWTASVTPGAGYNIYRCPTNTDTACSTPATIVATLPAGTVTYTDSGVAQTQHYLYNVRALVSGVESTSSSAAGWASPLPYDAIVRNSNVPTAATPTNALLISLTVINSGSQTWTGSGTCRIGVYVANAISWPVNGGSNNIAYLPSNISVLPGGQYTFLYTVQVPHTDFPGTRQFQHRLIRECGYSLFGPAIPAVTVAINPPVQGLGASFGSQTVPNNMIAGQTYEVQVAMINLSRTITPYQTFPWTPTNGFSLVPVIDIWGASSIPIQAGKVVDWNGIAVFSFQITAPSKPGVYPFQWQMQKSGVGRFGEVSPLKNINVEETTSSGIRYAPGARPTFIPNYGPEPSPW